MSNNPIDPSQALKKLFERSRGSRETSPLALFQQNEASSAPGADQPVEVPPGPSPAPAPVPTSVPTPVSSGTIRPVLASVTGKFQHLLKRTGSPKAQRIIGMDLGSSSVKVARVELTGGAGLMAGGRGRMTGCAVVDLAAGIDEGPEWENQVRQVLQRLKREGLLSGPIVLGFHHLDAVVESIRLPKMPSAEIPQAVQWEAKERLSLNSERMVIRHILTGEVVIDGQPQLEILVVAAPKGELISRWRLVSELGLKIVAIEPISLAGFYGLNQANLWKPTDLVGFLEMGLKSSHFSLVQGRVVRLARSFQVAGDSFTRSIADYCQLNYTQAEEMKRQFGVSKMALEEDRQETGHAAEDRVKVSHALGLHLEQLVAEIEASLRYFLFELGGSGSSRMDRLLITGGGGLLRQLPEFLTGRLSVPVSVADPLRAVELDPAVQRMLQPGWNQRLSVPVGLALRPAG